MTYQPKALRPFVGAKDYQESREFYRALAFEEVILNDKMSLFKVSETLSFYLQDYYVEEWVNNSMVSLEVDDIAKCAAELQGKNLQQQYKGVRFTEIKLQDWGKEFFMNDPSGVLWHFCEFNN
ncbi:glyoxalase [Pontibacter liquoris]|uniref:glyoxalase n=1 Tax=Pontibacter liquoris TaxID=2905677 RepID=UPI001FA7EEA0|nr:glyoxalase [Pontibacter liquoris]